MGRSYYNAVWFGGSAIGDGSFSDPFNNIKDALSSASSGDTLKLKPGQYNEDFTPIGEGAISGEPGEDHLME